MQVSKREAAVISGLFGAAGGLSLLNLYGVVNVTSSLTVATIVATTFASPLLGGILAVPATINAFSSGNSRLSRVFSAVAAGAGALSLVIPMMISGPDALGYPFLTLPAMTIAAFANVAAALFAGKKDVVQPAVSTKNAAPPVSDSASRPNNP